MTSEAKAERSESKSKAPYLASVEDTAEKLDGLFKELAKVQEKRQELQNEESRLQTHIAALQAVRQANGLPPMVPTAD